MLVRSAHPTRITTTETGGREEIGFYTVLINGNCLVELIGQARMESIY